MIRIGPATVTYVEWGAYTTYDDGTGFGTHPHETPHYHVISHRCGYGDDLLRYAREHEVVHHLVGEMFFGGVSPIIWALAHGEQVPLEQAAVEEAMVMTVQRWLRSNERPIIGGVDWDGLKRRAINLIGDQP